MSLRIRRLVAAMAAVVILLPAPARAGWVDGWWMYPYRNFATDTIGRRPYTAADVGVLVADWRISKLGIDRKGMTIYATLRPDRSYLCYRWIAIRHCEISDVWRSPGGHTDFIQIRGGENSQKVPTTVLIQDVYLHDGDGIPILIQDGLFDKILLKDVRVKNTTTGAIISAETGHVRTVIFDHCPALPVILVGPPGSIETIYVKRSPGLTIYDKPSAAGGVSGAKVVHLD